MTKENEKKKKSIGKVVLAAGVAGIIALSGSTLSITKVDAFEYDKTPIQTNQKSVNVYYNGKQVEFSDQKPVMENDRVKVPFRKVFEDMGCIVYYNNTENKIMALTKEGDILTHIIGTNEFDMNGEVKTFDSSSTIINDRTLIPLRAVAETLNSKVDWDDKNQTVTIEKEEKQLDAIEKEVMMHVLDVNYNPKDTKRYVSYKKQNPDLTVEQAIINVNMDLDKELAYMHGFGIGEDRELMHYEALKEDIEEIENPDDFYVYINKFNALPKDFEPKNLIDFESPKYGTGYYQFRSEISESLRKLIDDAKNQGLKMEIYVPYQRYGTADAMFFSGITSMRFDSDEGYVYNRFPQADMSELRTGFAVIFNASAITYEEQLVYFKEMNRLKPYQQEGYDELLYKIQDNKKSEEWLSNNAYKYGFIERYPSNKSNFTKYEYSPNFYRYVGKDISQTMYNENLCYDEFYSKYMNSIVNDEAYSIEPESTQKVLSKY